MTAREQNPEPLFPDRTDRSRTDAGMEVRRAVLGDEHVDRSIRSTSEITRDFQDFITRTAWGDIWSRPGLDRRSRSVAVITALAVLGHHDELRFHLPAGIRNGLTVDEIRELLLQAGLYAGVPVANAAFAIAAEVLPGVEERIAAERAQAADTAQEGPQ